MIQGNDIILVGGAPFERNWTSRQEIANVLSKTNRVLYVNPPGRIYDFLAGKSLAPSLKMYQSGLYVYQPPAVRLPLDYLSVFFNEYLQTVLRGFIQRQCLKLAFKNPWLWIFDYRSACFVGHFNERVSIYHCVDLWADLTLGRHCRKKVILAEEGHLAKRVDFVFTSAFHLKKFVEDRYQRDAHYFPHGINFDLFHQSVGDIEVADSLKSFSGKKLFGFIGNVGDWVDVDLLRSVAETYKDCQLILVGPVKETSETETLRRMKNVSFLGLQPKNELPRYLKVLDVCLIPFKVNELTKSVNPLKLLEYLCAGKPVVATHLPEMVLEDGLVYTAKDREAFLLQLRRALDEDSSTMQEKRIAFARGQTWAKRVDDMGKIIFKHTSVSDPPQNNSNTLSTCRLDRKTWR